MGDAAKEARPRIAVVLFNLGGPDKQEAVEPFLFNLFYDPAIIRVVKPLRWLIAKLISRRRGSLARANYALMGGGSPILPETEAQAAALETALGSKGIVRVFIAMRYWHPLSLETAREVKAFKPDRIVLLPLYPQFSTTTSASSLDAWRKTAREVGLDGIDQATVCCFPRNNGFVAAHAATIGAALAESGPKTRVLFSAHGLPESIVKAGDPYQWQVESTVDSITKQIETGRGSFDWRICYQSRVGPMKWLQPSIDEEIRRAGADRTSLIVVPVAFVSDHVETLVELDIEYKKLADEAGVPAYRRLPAVGTNDRFIGGLRQAVERALGRGGGLDSDERGRICPAQFSGCPNRAA
jgi:ferrochelatase